MNAEQYKTFIQTVDETLIEWAESSGADSLKHTGEKLRALLIIAVSELGIALPAVEVLP